jgi:hypothetical protein
MRSISHSATGCFLLGARAPSPASSQGDVSRNLTKIRLRDLFFASRSVRARAPVLPVKSSLPVLKLDQYPPNKSFDLMGQLAHNSLPLPGTGQG